MNRKKQMIEEMARIIAFDLCPNRHVHAKWGEEAQCYSDNNFAECTKIKNVVDKLYNAGYRKIPEGAVVLTKEEYKKLQALKDDYVKGYEAGVDEGWDNGWDNARKETAEKFAELVKMAFYYHFDELIPSIMADKIDEICKEISEGNV